jgi:hypothetical protein
MPEPMPDGKTVATHIKHLAGDDFAAESDLYQDVPCGAVARLTSGAAGLRQWNTILGANWRTPDTNTAALADDGAGNFVPKSEHWHGMEALGRFELPARGFPLGWLRANLILPGP